MGKLLSAAKFIRKANTRVSNVYLTQKQQWNPNRVLKKVRTQMLYFKKLAKQICPLQIVVIQSDLCEVECQENSHGLKIAILKIYQTIHKSVKDYNVQVVIVV